MVFEPVVPNPDLSIHASPPAPWDRVAVVCRWKDAHTFRRRWPEAAVVGPLRSIRGIDLLVRNLLANPQIRIVVVDGPDLTAGERTTAALQAFWCGTPGPRQALWPDIPSDLIEALIGEVRLITGVTPADLQGMTLPWVGDRPSGRHVFPPRPPEKTAAAPPGDPGQRVAGETLAEVYPAALREVLDFGLETPSKYGVTREILGLVTVIRDPFETVEDVIHGRPLPFKLSGEELAEYTRRISTDHAPTEDLYSYGSRMAPQVPRFLERLTRQPDDRGLFLTPWLPDDQEKPGGRPCLVGVQFRLLGGRLHLVANFRSHDLFDGYVHNLASLCAWLIRVACDHGHAIGTVEVLSVSAHLYDRDWNTAREIVQETRENIRLDPRSTWQVDVVDGKIRALALWPDGSEIVEVFEGTNAQDLRRRVERSGLVTSIGNALWLGAELARAEAQLRS